MIGVKQKKTLTENWSQFVIATHDGKIGKHEDEIVLRNSGELFH